MRYHKLFPVLTAFFFLTGLYGCAKKATIEKPPAEEPAPMTAGETRDFTVNGMKVIFKKVDANRVVSAQLYILGGAAAMTQENAGIEQFILQTALKGSERFPKENLNDELARTGAVISSSPNVDYTSYTMRCLVRDFSDIWNVYTDVLFNPVLDSAEVELVRERTVESIRQLKDSPDAWLGVLADRHFYAGTPYEVRPGGSEESIAGLTIEDMRRYLADSFVTSRMLLVVVGNLELENLRQKIQSAFGDRTVGMYERTSLPVPPMANAPHVTVEERELPTNYIRGQYAAPAMSNPDYSAMWIASSILRQRLFEEVRTKRGLSYAPSASFSNRLSNYGYIYVTAVDPDTTVKVMFGEVKRIQSEPISAKELKDKINVAITRYHMENETNAAQARILASYEIKGGGYEKIKYFEETLKMVTPADVLRATTTYMRNFNFIIIGDPAKIDESLFTSM